MLNRGSTFRGLNMALAPAIVVQLPGYPFENFPSLEDIDALRAVPSIGLLNGDNYVVDGGAALGDGNGGIYTWNDASTATDDGSKVIKPTDVPPLNAGRWILSGPSTAELEEVERLIAVAENPIALIATTESMTVGSIVRTSNGHLYRVAPTDATDQHLTTAGGVKLYIVDPQITPDALGAPVDGIADDAPYVERAFQISKTVHLLGISTYRLASMIGLPDQNLYVPQSFYLIGNGAHVVVSSPLVGGVPEAIFTSAAAKASPDSTSNLFTAKMFFTGLNFTQDATSVIFNGDRLYQAIVANCSFDAVDTVIKSFRAKGALLEGYMQSFALKDSQFSDIRRIVDAKRAFDVTFSNLKCSNCTGGIYIDSTTEDPAVSTLRVDNILFQGGGVAMAFGKVIGGTIKGLYSEANAAGDTIAEKCDVWFKAGPSASSGVVMTGCMFQPTVGQQADTAYVSIRIDSDGGGASGFIQLDGCWTSGTRLVSPSRAEVRGIGSTSATMLRNALVPFGPDTARRTTVGGTLTLLASTNLSAGVYRVAPIDAQYIKSMLTQSQRACSGVIKVLMQHRTAGGIVNGTSLAVIHFVAMGASEGVTPANAVNDVYITFELERVIQVAASQIIDNLGGGAVTRTHFTAPTLSVTRTGDQFDLKLSGYAAPSNPGYGAADRMTSHIQIEADARNNGTVRTSPITLGT